MDLLYFNEFKYLMENIDFQVGNKVSRLVFKRTCYNCNSIFRETELFLNVASIKYSISVFFNDSLINFVLSLAGLGKKVYVKLQKFLGNQVCSIIIYKHNMFLKVFFHFYHKYETLKYFTNGFTSFNWRWVWKLPLDLWT